MFARGKGARLGRGDPGANLLHERARLRRRFHLELLRQPAREVVVRLHGAGAVTQPIEQLEEFAHHALVGLGQLHGAPGGGDGRRVLAVTLLQRGHLSSGPGGGGAEEGALASQPVLKTRALLAEEPRQQLPPVQLEHVGELARFHMILQCHRVAPNGLRIDPQLVGPAAQDHRLGGSP